MSAPPRLFDSDLLTRRRARARRIGGADFLQEAAISQISERLEEVNRPFRRITLISSRPDLWEPSLAAETGGEVTVVATGDTLDLPEGSADLVVHALDLHWSNDPVGQLIQARRGLIADGLFLGVLFGGATLGELRIAFAEAETTLLGGLSPRVAPMGEIRDLGGLLQRAGFALPVADSQPLDVRYESALHLMRDLRAMGETNVMLTRHRQPMSRSLLAGVCAAYAQAHSGEDGRVRATFELVFLTGWAPAPSQPKPLRAGSAVARLSDALEEAERAAAHPDVEPDT